MLIQFRVENYRSFRDETVLFMTATESDDILSSLLPCVNEKLLPVTAIFGANASGKSNLVNAFRCMAMMVMESNEWRDYHEDDLHIRTVMPEYSPYAFDDTTKDQDITFEIWFTSFYEKQERTFDYGFSWNKNGITEEWLDIKDPETDVFSHVFSREEQNINFDSDDIASNECEIIQRSLERQVLITSLGATLKVDILQAVHRFFFLSQVKRSNGTGSQKLPFDFKVDPAVQKDVLRYIQAFDKSIIGFEIDETIHSADEYRNVMTIHRSGNGKGIVKLPISEESAGTLKMIHLYQNLKNALKYGTVLWIDELNSQLHPLLVRVFILNFINPKINKNHAQLVFTTHDPWTIGNGLLRRDEIWFVEKTQEGVSDLYSLADFKEEKDSETGWSEAINDADRYLYGQYGAIPELEFLMPEEGK